MVEATLSVGFVKAKLGRLIGDRAYDSDGLDEALAIDHGIEMIAPHRRNRKRKTQDGRKLRRYMHLGCSLILLNR